ncbi:MAG: hypothetical protein ACREDR_03920 [Blastocatellia bacterium]
MKQRHIEKAIDSAIELLVQYPNSERAAATARLIVDCAVAVNGPLPEAALSAWIAVFIRTPRQVIEGPLMLDLQHLVEGLSAAEADLIVAIAGQKTPSSQQAKRLQQPRVRLKGNRAVFTIHVLQEGLDRAAIARARF